MKDSFLAYYHNELSALREEGQTFAHTYPKVAERLKLNHAEAEDPFIARLIESVAFLTARIHQRMDSDEQQFINEMIRLIYPMYLMPIPASAIMQLNASMALTTPYQLARGTEISTQTHQKKTCHFTTAFDVSLYPVKQTDIKYSHTPPVPKRYIDKTIKSALTLQISTLNPHLNLQDLNLSELVYYIDLPLSDAFSLYELIFKDLSQLVITSPEDPSHALSLPASCVQPVGFDDITSLLPLPKNGFDGYRMLLEFFSFPQKFLFFKLTDLAQYIPSFCHHHLHIHFLFQHTHSPLKKEINVNSIKLHCTPIINLFKQVAEPIQFDGNQQQYPIIADAHIPLSDIEVANIDHINITSESLSTTLQCEPFLGGHYHSEQSKTLHWQTQYQPCTALGLYPVPGYECAVRLIDQYHLQPSGKRMVLTPYITCTNRLLTLDLPHGKNRAHFEFKNAQHDSIPSMHVVTNISTPKYWPQHTEHKLKLLSHLNLNQFSLHNPTEALSGLKSILNLYQFGEHQLSSTLIQSITRLTTQAITIRHPDKLKQSFCQGTLVEMTLNENVLHYNETILFSRILHEFLSQRCSINSFMSLKVISQQRGELLTWAPQLGCKATA